MSSKARELANLGNAYSDGALSNRNLIINGAMQVAQRGTSFTNAPDSGYTLDRWKPQIGSGAQQANISQVTDAPTFFERSLEVEVTTANASPSGADYYLLSYGGFEVQDISSLALGNAASKPITLSFWVKSNKTGTAYAEIQYTASIGSVENSIAYTVNSANTWEYKTLTFDAPTAFAPTTTTSNARGLVLYFWLMGGSNYSGSPLADGWGNNTNRITGITNFFDTVGNTWQITGVQLEVGDTATPFEHRSYGQELALCQRYFCKIENTTGASKYFGILQAYTSGFAYGVLADYPQIMRATPSVTQGGSFGFYNSSSGNAGADTAIGNFTSTSRSWITEGWGGASGLTAGHACGTFWLSGAYLTADAEL